MLDHHLLTLYALGCALLPCLMVLWHRRQAAPWTHRLWAFVFCCYLWMVYTVTGAGGLSDMILQLHIFRDLGINSLADLIAVLLQPNGPSVFRCRLNLMPLRYIDRDLFLNILMTIPFGFFLPFLYRGWRKFSLTVAAGALFSLLIECSQLLTNRACDIDDLIANTLGAACGYALCWFCGQLFGKYLYQTPTDRREPVLLVLASFAGMFFLYHPLWFSNLIGS